MTDQSSSDPAGTARGKRKTVQGVVTSAKPDKSITVEIERVVRHPMYEKFIKQRSKLHAHDETNEANAGDVVELTSTRPISKLKRWRLTRVVRRGQG